MSHPHRPARMIYVDDSGAETTGFATYSWVSVMLDEWREAHRSAVLDEAFERFSNWKWLRVGSAYSKTALRRDHFSQ